MLCCGLCEQIKAMRDNEECLGFILRVDQSENTIQTSRGTRSDKAQISETSMK